MTHAPHTPTNPPDGGPPPARRRGRALALGLALALAAPLAAAGPAAAAAPAAAAPAAVQDWGGNQPNAVGGTDYYLDATTGDDAAPGTSPEQAWRTLAKANATTFAPGDRILLKAGEEWHDAQLIPQGSGEAGRPIVIDAYGDPEARRPYIAANGNVPSPFTSGTTKNPETVGMTGAVVLRNQQYWEIHSLELSNDDDFGTDITTGSYVRDGVSISINADLLPEGADTVMDHFRITNLYVHDIDGPSTWQQIHYGGVVFQVFGSKPYTEYATGGYYFQDVRIEDNTFVDVELHAIEFAFNWFYDRSADLGQYDEAGKWHEGWEQLWVRTRDLYSRDVYIGHNYAESIGQGAIQLANTKDMLVEYNEVNGFLQRYNAVSCGLYLWAGADTVMQFNEVYGGPYDEYDGTPWDLEYTNFDVTYQYNYSHDNAAGWMAYMGNSSNSVARYNLSVNDNGVLVKNMLSTNYSPSYFMNNVFVYDAEQMDYVHDERFLSPVYFLNNVFYNTSTTRSTPWARHADGLRQAVFSANAFYEAGGTHSADRPADDRAVLADPQFVADPADYATDLGVDRIRDSAAGFRLAATSPLIDAGRYNPHAGTADFFGTGVYWGDGIDIGLHEVVQGTQVTDPVDTDPVEQGPGEDRVDLARGKPATASSTHPHGGGVLSAANLVDGDATTRWAAADDAAWPIVLEIDLEEPTTFDEVVLDEHTDSGTEPRVQSFEIQRRDPDSGQWVTVVTQDDGIGRDHVVDGFGAVTGTGLRVLLTERVATEQYNPTLTGIAVYGPDGPVAGSAVVTPRTTEYDRNPDRADDPANAVAFDVTWNGDTLDGLRYVGTEGNVLGSLDAADYARTDDGDTSTFVLAPAFLAARADGEQGVQLAFGSGTTARVTFTVVDTTGEPGPVDPGGDVGTGGDGGAGLGGGGDVAAAPGAAGGDLATTGATVAGALLAAAFAIGAGVLLTRARRTHRAPTA